MGSELPSVHLFGKCSMKSIHVGDGGFCVSKWSFPKQKEGRLGWGSYLLSIELGSWTRIVRRQGT